MPAGDYDWMRLKVLASKNSQSESYIKLESGQQYPLWIPSGSETGLKLVKPFKVAQGSITRLVIDFDLRKSITCPPGQSPACILRPVERLVDNTTVGNVQGTVDASLVPTNCTPGVYLYNGTVSAPEDMNSAAASTDTNQPLASKVPVLAQSGGYYYQFTFLPPATYSVAFTCQAALDNPDQADTTVTFSPVKTAVAVTANQTLTVNFP